MADDGAAGEMRPDSWEVPEYTVHQVRERRSLYCVAVFVLNEGERLHRQLARMQDVSDAADIIIADGGSTDGGTEPAALSAWNLRAILVKTGPGRLGAQMRMVFDYALREGYEGVITIDGNNKDDPSAIPVFVERLASGIAHVQGSRFIEGGRGIRTPLMRHLAVRLIHAPLISLASRTRHTDTTNGFRGYSSTLLRDERVQVFRDIFVGYELHYYLAIRAARLGYPLEEVPVTREYPMHGATPTKIRGLRGPLIVLLALLRAVTGRFNPAAPADSGKEPRA